MDDYHKLRADYLRMRENEPERRALQFAVAALRKVGNDYPGSSCQQWCNEKADEALRIAGLSDSAIRGTNVKREESGSLIRFLLNKAQGDHSPEWRRSFRAAAEYLERLERERDAFKARAEELESQRNGWFRNTGVAMIQRDALLGALERIAAAECHREDFAGLIARKAIEQVRASVHVNATLSSDRRGDNSDSQ